VKSATVFGSRREVKLLPLLEICNTFLVQKVKNAAATTMFGLSRNYSAYLFLFYSCKLIKANPAANSVSPLKLKASVPYLSTYYLCGMYCHFTLRIFSKYFFLLLGIALVLLTPGFAVCSACRQVVFRVRVKKKLPSK